MRNIDFSSFMPTKYRKTKITAVILAAWLWLGAIVQWSTDLADDQGPIMSKSWEDIKAIKAAGKSENPIATLKAELKLDDEWLKNRILKWMPFDIPKDSKISLQNREYEFSWLFAKVNNPILWETVALWKLNVATIVIVEYKDNQWNPVVREFILQCSNWLVKELRDPSYKWAKYALVDSTTYNTNAEKASNDFDKSLVIWRWDSLIWLWLTYEESLNLAKKYKLKIKRNETDPKFVVIVYAWDRLEKKVGGEWIYIPKTKKKTK